jgi:hypothetical protein
MAVVAQAARSVVLKMFIALLSPHSIRLLACRELELAMQVSARSTQVEPMSGPTYSVFYF